MIKKREVHLSLEQEAETKSKDLLGQILNYKLMPKSTEEARSDKNLGEAKQRDFNS